MKLKFIIVLIFLGLLSCEKIPTSGAEVDIPILYIFKYKKPEYISKAIVMMRDDNKTIRGIFDPQSQISEESTIVLDNNFVIDDGIYISNGTENYKYYIGSHLTAGIHTGILDYERSNFPTSWTKDTLQAHLIDTDPFIEMYCSNGEEVAYISIYNLKQDTAAYNKLLKCIDEGTLESELGFVRLK